METKKRDKSVEFRVEREMKIFFALILVIALIGNLKAMDFETQVNALKNGISNIEISPDLQLPMPEPVVVKSGDFQEEIQQGILDVEIFKYFDDILKNPVYPREIDPGWTKSFKATQDVVYSINLEEIKNSHLKTRITFKTSRGTTVHVSGTRASNCSDGTNTCADSDKYFVVLLTDRGETFFVKGEKIANFSIFLRGKQSVLIDGEKFTLRIYVKPSSPKDSTLQIDGSLGTVLNATLEQIGNALMDAGTKIKLSKEYLMGYSNEVLQDRNGNAKFTDKMIFGFFPLPIPTSISEINDYKCYIILESQNSESGSHFPEMDKNFGFRKVREINRSILEIYRL